MTLRPRFCPMSFLARRLTPAVAALAVLALAAVPPASAAVVEAGGVKAGAQPRSTLLYPGLTEKPEVPLYAKYPAYPESFANPTGAPVLASNHTYAIYWDPTKYLYHGDWQHLIDTFLQGMGAESGSLGAVFSVDEQYTDKANQRAAYRSTFMGAVTDTNKYPVVGNCTDPHPLAEEDAVTCLTDQQIRTQLEFFMSQHSLPRGMGNIYYVLTPPGVTVCLDEGGATGHCSDYEATQKSYEKSFCSYHSDISVTNPSEGDANTILYAVVPWTAGGLADGHLYFENQTRAFDCQDGGYNPASEPIEQFEEAKEKTAKQIEEFENKTAKEKLAQENEEALEGPHQQEPNQPTPGVGPDGFFDTGLADLIVNQIAVEQQNTVTDPLLNAWRDKVGNEATDECRNWFASSEINGSVSATKTALAGTLSNQVLGSTNFYLNDAFNLAALKLSYPGVPCLPGTRLVPQFTVPNPVNSGELVGFDGMESDIALDAGTTYNAKGEAQLTYATYTWDFGDGSPTVTGYAPGQAPHNPPSTLCEEPWLPPCAGSTFHSYTYGGVYNVTLTVTDVGGNTASVVEPITVVGPPPPA
ncbi:MAG: PKD domain-containing protein, partial [Solirubrobacterales bacterium]